MKISLVATGGTIGCRKTRDGAIKLNKAAIEQIASIVDADSVFDDVEIHSERIEFSDLSAMRSVILRALDTNPDGIIVSHGTDTLAFASAYLAYALSDTPVPIVMCSADRPLTDPESNGFDILQSAKNFIKRAQKGVYVVFKNPGLTPTVHHAARLLPAHLHEHMYYSIGGALNFKDTGLMRGMDFDLDGHKAFCIIPYMGLDYSLFNVDGYSAIVHSAYHSGRVDAAAFNGFAAAHPNIPIFMTAGRKKYDEKAFAENVTQIHGITQTALYIKVLIGLKNNVKDLKAFVSKNACGEIVQKY